jgi:hypothetical protein
MPLPLGVSFVTFTLTAYVIDIYRGTFAARVSDDADRLCFIFFAPDRRPHFAADRAHSAAPASATRVVGAFLCRTRDFHGGAREKACLR